MAEGRTAEFEAFVAAHGLALARLARLLTRSRDEAADLTQVTLERTFVRWRTVSAADDPFAYADLTEAETAQTLGISRGAVKTHAHRGLARLRVRAVGVADITGSENGHA